MNHRVIISILLSVITGTICSDQHSISESGVYSQYGSYNTLSVVGLFKPLSYQTRAVQLALTDDELSDRVCFEPHELSPSTPWIESELATI